MRLYRFGRLDQTGMVDTTGARLPRITPGLEELYDVACLRIECPQSDPTLGSIETHERCALTLQHLTKAAQKTADKIGAEAMEFLLPLQFIHMDVSQAYVRVGRAQALVTTSMEVLAANPQALTPDAQGLVAQGTCPAQPKRY